MQRSEYAFGRVAFVQQAIYDFIHQFGYIALYLLFSAGIVGLPLPDETLMTFVGSLTVAGGPFRYTPTLLIIYAGTMTGMTISYMLGNRVGKPFLYRYGKWIKLTPKRLEVAEGWFHKYGLWTVFFGYFVPGVRHLTCYLSGMSGVRFYKYAFFAGTGALLWCTTFVTLGHFIGRNWEQLLQLLHKYMGMSAAIIAAIVVVGIIVYMRLRKKTVH